MAGRYKVNLVDRGPLFDSYLHCCNITGIPASIMKQAKRDGADFTDNHCRVRLYDLLRWLFNEGNTDKVDWGAHGEKFAALITELKYNLLNEKLVDRETVHGVAVEAMTATFLILRRTYNQAPPLLKGRSETEIAKKLKEACDEIEQKVRDAINKLKK